MSTYQELLHRQEELRKQADELARQIEDAKRQARADVIQQIREMMADHGLTVDDLGPARSRRRAAGKPAGGGKVAAKYRHPETGETWSGRGLEPKWLRAEIAGGKSRQDFLV